MTARDLDSDKIGCDKILQLSESLDKVTKQDSISRCSNLDILYNRESGAGCVASVMLT